MPLVMLCSSCYLFQLNNTSVVQTQLSCHLCGPHPRVRRLWQDLLKSMLTTIHQASYGATECAQP